MRTPDQLVHSRARVRQRYALLPLEGYPTSNIPAWPGCEARVLASPALGAQFVEYLFDIPAGKGTAQGEALEQVFGYVMSGLLHVTVAGQQRDLRAGGFFFVPEKDEWLATAKEPTRLLLLRKRFEPTEI